jgi:hypothetical protein
MKAEKASFACTYVPRPSLWPQRKDLVAIVQFRDARTMRRLVECSRLPRLKAIKDTHTQVHGVPARKAKAVDGLRSKHRAVLGCLQDEVGCRMKSRLWRSLSGFCLRSEDTDKVARFSAGRRSDVPDGARMHLDSKTIMSFCLLTHGNNAYLVSSLPLCKL